MSLAVFLCALVTGYPAAQPEPIRIGLVISVTGDLRPWGVEGMGGAQLAVAHYNRRGGYRGRPVELVVEDSSSRPDRGASAGEKLVSEGCVAMIGDIASGITRAIREKVADKGVPQVVIAATRDDLCQGSRYMFRTCYTDSEQGPAMAKFAFEVLHYRRVSVVTDVKQPFCVELSQSFRESFRRRGGRVVGEGHVNTGQTNFADVARLIKAGHPDGVFCGMYFTESGPLIRQTRESGLPQKVRFLGSDGFDAAELVPLAGPGIDGSYMSNHYVNDEPSPRVTVFRRAWRLEHDGADPQTTMAALGFDAAALTLDALDRAKKPDQNGLRDALASTVGFRGVTGEITLKGSHGNPRKRVVIAKILVGPPPRQSFAKAYEYSEIVGRRAKPRKR